MERCTLAKETDLMLDESNEQNMEVFEQLVDGFFLNYESNKYVTDQIYADTRDIKNRTADLNLKLNHQRRAFFKIEASPELDTAYQQYASMLRMIQSNGEWGMDGFKVYGVDCDYDRYKETYLKMLKVNSLQLEDYQTFKTGRVKNGKQEAKLFKFLKQQGILDQNDIEAITHKRQKNETLYLCVSRNPIDYLMASTNQSFTSCISLESGYDSAYYMGLAGLTSEADRAIAFITNGKLKRYTVNGATIKHFAYKCRTWLIVGQYRQVHVVGSYPHDGMSMVGVLNRCYSHLFFTPHYRDFKSRYGNKTIKHEDGTMSMIYIDTVHPRYRSASGTHRYNKDGPGRLFGAPDFSWTEGFENLRDYNDLYGSRYECENCGYHVDEDYAMSYGNCIYCESCFDELFGTCARCCDTEWRDDMVEVTVRNRYGNDNEWWCEHCAEYHAVRCEDCDEYYDADLMHETANGTLVCPDCVDEYAECENCGDLYLINDMYHDAEDDAWRCRDCQVETLNADSASEVYTQIQYLVASNLNNN